jgi:hypothetical protein
VFLCSHYKRRTVASGVPRAGGISRPRRGQPVPMFFFFSNRLGCLGSIMISLVITGILLLLLGVL